MVWHGMVWYGIVWCGIVRCGMHGLLHDVVYNMNCMVVGRDWTPLPYVLAFTSQLLTCFNPTVHSFLQLNILRSLKKSDGKPLLMTYRPIQATNRRKIYATFAGPTDGTAALNSVPFVSVFFAITSFILMY